MQDVIKLNEILNIPLTYIQLRSLYIKANDIKETKKRPDITVNDIKKWLGDNGYKLESIKIYNVTAKKNMKYYKITF